MPNKIFSKKRAALLSMVLLLIAVFLFCQFDSNLALAQTADIGMDEATNFGLSNGNGQTPQNFLVTIVRWLLTFMGIVAVVMVMWSGLLWMTSEGDPAKIDRAKKTLVNAVIGLVVILSAFAIVSFISMKMGASGPIAGNNNPPSSIGSLGVIGTCSIQNVYPEPSQQNVPRNTSLIVTFREEISPDTICDDGNGSGTYCDCVGVNCDSINTANVKLFLNSRRSDCMTSGTNCVTNVYAISSDNRQFVFVPQEFLGNSSSDVWYSMHLNNNILTMAGTGLGNGAFSDCFTDYFEWTFEVSTEFDWDPPKVLGFSLFPFPDNAQDAYTVSTAFQATGAISVNDIPDARQNGSFGTPIWAGGPTTKFITLSNEILTHNQSGTLNVSIQADAATAVLSNGATGLSTVTFTGDTIDFPGFFSMTITGFPGTYYEAGDSWNIPATAYVSPNTLTIGTRAYTFVAGTPVSPNEIQVGATQALTANNIVIRVNADPSSTVTLTMPAMATPTLIPVTANTAGTSGNGINLSTDNATAFSFIQMTGGTNAGASATPLPTSANADQPRNSVIHIDFDDAMLPMTISGNATDLNNTIRVRCDSGCEPTDSFLFNCTTGAVCSTVSPCPLGDICVDGAFEVSNQYKTVEFISNNLCGVNGCGERIYCLPESSEISVEMVAANLVDCTPDNCVSKIPYNTCSSPTMTAGHCQDAGGANYPMSTLAFDGLMDKARNSLDGNRSDDAEGPVSFWNDNPAPVGGAPGGDNFEWSFWIGRGIATSAPIIDVISPNIGALGVSLSDPITIRFDSLMMSSSLNTGKISIDNGLSVVDHQQINIRNFSGLAVGYWTESNQIDISVPADDRGDITETTVKHTIFTDATSYRAQVGSGIKNIYQNCFKPSEGPGCAGVNTANPTCCNGTVSAGSACP